MIHHGLLHRMKATVGAGQMLNRYDMAAVQRSEEPNACIHWGIGKTCPSKPPDKHGTCTAISFGAAFLGAGQSALET
jgi:hypothetical protein